MGTVRRRAGALPPETGVCEPARGLLKAGEIVAATVAAGVAVLAAEELCAVRDARGSEDVARSRAALARDAGG